MKLERADTYLSLITNLGVVIGIIFIVIEINQNTNAIYASTTQALEQSVSEVMAPWTSSIDNAVLMNRAGREYESLTEEEKIFVGLLIRRLYLHMDSYYWAHRSGVLPTELWEREQAVLRYWVSSPGGRIVWDSGLGYSEPFESFVERDIIKR